MKASCAGFYIICFLLLQKGVLSLSCGISDFNEILKETEHSFINISYSVNVTEGLEFTDKFNAVYEVCERNSIKTCCTFIWNKGFNNMMGADVSQKTGVLCTGKQQTSSNSVVTLELQISQLVSRSLSVMKLSTSTNGSLKITRNIGVEVLYPPIVTSLTVDGQEVNGGYVINDRQVVNIFCSFDKGNPPAIFRLLDKSGRQLKLAYREENLNHSLKVQCEDDWPVVRCEAAGSKHNRSVLFLVRCSPQFVDTFPNVTHHNSCEHWHFNLKAHTKTFKRCVMASSLLKVRREVNCTLTGAPPDLLLTLHLDREDRAKGENWQLTFYNEMGSTSTTLLFNVNTRDNKSSNGSNGSNVLIIAAGAGAGVLVLIIPCIIVIVIKTKNRSRSVKVRKVESTAGNEGNREENVRVNEENNANEEATGVRQSERKSESGGSTHAPEAGVGSGTDSSSTRSSSSGSDKTPSHPNYDSTAMQQVELHTYKNLPIKTSGYTTPTPRKESHSYLKLRTSKAQQETPNPPIVEVQNSDIYDTPYQTREGLQGTDAPPPPDKETVNGEGYETPPPPEKGTPPEEAYANQGQLSQVIEGDEVSYYNTA